MLFELSHAGRRCHLLPDCDVPAPSGHAFEVRVYAEDPDVGFLPQTGRILHVRWPEGARVDTGIEQGTAVTSFYLTDVKADFNPSAGAPSRLKVRFTVTGLGAVLDFLHRNPHGSLFAHYIRPNGRVKGTRKFGHLRGPCGDLTTSRTRLLPYASELGNWKVYLDTNRSYRKREPAQVVVGFKVRRIGG